MEFSTLLNKMLVFIVLMLIGYFLARRGTLGKDFVRIGSKLAVDVFMVGTILNAMLSAGDNIQAETLPSILLLTSVTMVLGFVVAWAVARFLHMEKDRAAGFEVLSGIGNTIFIALPILSSLYGAYAVLIVSISCIPFNVMLYGYGGWRLARGNAGQKIQLRKIFSIPLISTLVGIILLLTGLPVPAAVRDLLTTLGGATMPIAMLVIGVSLSSVSLLDAFKNRQLALLSAVRLLLIPAVTWCVCRLMTDDPVLLISCLVIAGSPCAVVASILAIENGQDALYCSEAVQHSTICSIVTIPLLIEIFSRIS